MFPTLSSGDVIVVNKSNIDLSPLNIVLIRVKTNSIRSEYIVKRIIAVGGDHIIIDYVANSVKVNGMALVEPYININVADPMQTYDDGKQVVEYIVPNDCVFVLGDNRNHSTDSRSIHIGMVSKKDVIGVVKKCLIL